MHYHSKVYIINCFQAYQRMQEHDEKSKKDELTILNLASVSISIWTLYTNVLPNDHLFPTIIFLDIFMMQGVP